MHSISRTAQIPPGPTLSRFLGKGPSRPALSKVQLHGSKDSTPAGQEVRVMACSWQWGEAGFEVWGVYVGTGGRLSQWKSKFKTKISQGQVTGTPPVPLRF